MEGNLFIYIMPQIKAGKSENPAIAQQHFRALQSQQKSDQPKPVAFTIFGWAVRGSACFAGGRCGASRLARCAGKCSRISSAPRPYGFDPMYC